MTTAPAAGTARCHLLVRGVVQGVGFRFFTERAARRLGLAGWVRNLSDGRVEVVAEGLRPALEALIAEVRRGPSGAMVQHVDVTWESATGLAGFHIR